ncbi:1-phosphofructokinase [Pelolinea submarina]|uniref:1-phosphofructokinase n=1 Tax=Pelolinea submarina TaxID=913107 RepID=A0A347ZWJ7_9CHLR|nr:1-phosphofructokinase [Pelolinea submarina]REG05420.1 fructose-1-phosphate kinase [Pelolinea submarina]BBB49678.1 1-phosphofructokinase [Pelolinea submarina]
MIYTVTLNPALDKEYHVAELLSNTVLRAASVKVDFGGKGFNIARMITALGSQCAALGFIGGHTGQVLREGLESTGIPTDFVRVSEETRTNISIVNDKDSAYYKVNEAGPQVSEPEVEELLHKVEGLVQPDDWWVLAGSLPRGVPADIYARLIALIRRGGAWAVLDSSGEAFRLGCAAEPFLVKPNLEEIAQITDLDVGDAAGIHRAINSVHKLGVKNIILSAGGGMSICSDGLRVWSGQPPKIEEKNPTGAGDAMLGAVVDQLSRGTTLPEAYRWGLAAGSAAAALPGTGMPTRAQVQALIEQVVISEE